MNIALPTIDMKATGERIKMLRIKNGYTVRELTLKLGMSVASVYKWQQGQSIADPQNLIALSDLFQVPITDILVCDYPEKHPLLPDGHERRDKSW